MNNQEPTPKVGESRDGRGAGDHDRKYEFGQRLGCAQPGPFTHAEFARLLILRGRVQALIEHFNDLKGR